MKLAYITLTLGLGLSTTRGIDLDDVSMTPILPGASPLVTTPIADFSIIVAFPQTGS